MMQAVRADNPEARLPARFVVPVLASLALVMHLRTGLSETGFLTTGLLADTDSWARTQRILELWQGAGWFTEIAPRLNAPLGLSLHWTRPLDILILLPAMALHALAGLPARDAVLLAGAAICPLLHLACALAAAHAARPVWPRIGPIMAGLLLLANPVAFGYSAFGRSDHHTLILLTGVLALGAALRAAFDPADRRAAWWTGAFAGLGVWVSPEALLFAAPILASFGLFWVIEGRPGWPMTGMARQGLRAAGGFALTTAMAVVVEHPPAQWLAGDYDKVSAQHVALGLLAAGVFAVTARLAGGPLRRAIAGTTLAGLALGLLLLLWPQALRGSLAGADAAALAEFLPRVQEMQPLDLRSLAGWQTVILVLGPVILAPLALVFAWRGWRRQGQLAAAPILGLTFLACLIATLLHRRFGSDLAAPGCLLAAGLPVLALRARLSVPARTAVALAALLGTLGMASIAFWAAPSGIDEQETAANAASNACASPSLVDALNRDRPGQAEGAPDPILFSNNINIGPELAWRTPYRLVGSPYHRGGAAFVDTLVFFSATEDAAALAVAERRRVALVLLCPTGAFAPDSFAARLQAGELPGWLVPVPVPGLPSGVLLFTRR
jgi:hypothetical protein